MRISKKDLNMLLVLISLGIMLAAYFLLYSPALEEAGVLRSETESLKPQLAELNASKSKEAEYQNEINAIKESIDTEIKRYPVSVTPESIIMYIVGIEKKHTMDISTVGFTEPWVVGEFTTFEEDEPKTMNFYSVDFTMDGTFSYKSMKDFLRGIPTEEEHTSLAQIDMSYDASTGNLSSSILMKKYFISDGTETEASVVVPGIKYGLDDLFGTIAGPETEPEPEVEGEAGVIPEI